MSVSQVETNPEGFEDWNGIHRLLTEAYAYMEGRIDPPSFLTQMDVADVARKAKAEDVFVIQDRGQILACGFGHAEGAAYEIGKLAVAASQQGRGLGRAVIDAAADHARAQGFETLQLYARVELVENHAIYTAMGFAAVAEFSHPGFDRATALIFSRAL